MTMLALEFSSDRRSVAVVRDRALLSEVVFEGAVRTPIFQLIEDALKQAGISRDAVDTLVVGLGPGSYTGVRLAIAVAQGWQLATGMRVIGVNSLETLASLMGSARVRLAIDAQKSECAVAEAEGGSLVTPVRLIANTELAEDLQGGDRIAGPDVFRLLGGGELAYPTAAVAAQLAVQRGVEVSGASLSPVYLREASFAKAPPARVIC
jgi:tRNA threonylcarbamoyladenosine biosynthesis protein TsaB